MARVKFNAVPLDYRVKASLERIVADNLAGNNIIRRAKAILLLWNGYSIKEVVEDLGYNRKSVAKFRTRFQEKADYLNSLALSREIDDDELTLEIIDLLSDRKRSGKPMLYPQHVRDRIAGLAKANPSDFDYGVEKMTLPLIKEQAIAQNLVTNISIPTVWRIVNSANAT